MQKDTRIESHTIVVTVDNEPGVLARVIGLFAGRGYNIESLTVAEIDRAAHTSRITVVTSGPPAVIEQIKAQLGRLVPVHRVVDISTEKPGIEREMALVKVIVPYTVIARDTLPVEEPTVISSRNTYAPFSRLLPVKSHT